MVLGSVLGGLLTDWFGWSAVFYVNVLLAGVGVIAALVLLPQTARTGSGGFDVPGALLGTVASTLLVFALVQGPEAGWTAPVVVWSLVVALVLFVLFLLVEAKAASPLVPLRLFRNRDLSTGSVITFLFMATFGALAYFLTQLWQVVQGYSAWQTGFAFVVPSGCVLLGTVIGGKAATRLGVRTTLLLSLALGIMGTPALALSIGAGVSYAVLVPSLAVLSLGRGMVFTTMFAAASTGAPAGDQGIGGGIATTGQQIGGAVGLAVLIALAASANGPRTDADPAQLVAGIKLATWAIAAGIAVTVLAALRLRNAATSDDRRAPAIETAEAPVQEPSSEPAAEGVPVEAERVLVEAGRVPVEAGRVPVEGERAPVEAERAPVDRVG
ncbi:MFS transporter [Streptomyces sp. NPDC003077]|uniref:MFS transporter n=1 Tax=Streptomyces sp. NPDC003077 TaxID=3154443 RepID=UPI0033B9A120